MRALWSAEAGQTIGVPETLASNKGPASLEAGRRATMESLSHLAGSEVRMVDVGGGDVRLAGADRLLPADFAPAVILDASGRVRETYKLWEDRVGNLVRLPASSNDYRGLTVSLWRRSAGRARIAAPTVRAEIAEAIAEAITSRATEDWLIVHYLGEERLVGAVRALLGPERAERIVGLTWGMHHGTNAYAHIPNIVIVGQLTYGQAAYPALASAVIGNGAPELSAEEEQALQHGEYAHHLLQAVCRSSARRARDGRAGEARAYLIMSPAEHVEPLLGQCFPGHQRRVWRPETAKLPTGHAGELLRYLDSRFMADRNAVVRKGEVSAHLAIPASHLPRLLRRPEVVDKLDQWSVEIELRTFRLPAATFEPWGGEDGYIA
jgi:hypothetical protein